MKAALIGAFFLYSFSAQAATIIVSFTADNYQSAIQRDVGDGAGFIDTTTGMFTFTRIGGTYAGPPTGAFNTFCIEPREFVSQGSTYTYDVSPLESGATNIGGMGAAKANLLRELFGRYYPVIGAPIDAQKAGAMQIAIWEIVRENSGTLNVSSGNVVFQNAADPSATVLAQTYLSSLNGQGTRMQNLYALTAVGVQDVIIQTTPEPVTFITAGTVLVALGVLRRRQKRAA